MPLTDYIEATETILTQTAARLASYPDWHVATFPGTSLTALQQSLGTAQLPAAIVLYNGARRDPVTRRRITLQILLATSHGSPATAAANLRTLLDETITLLDDYTYHDATWVYQSDLPLDFGNGLNLLLLDFHVLLN